MIVWPIPTFLGPFRGCACQMACSHSCALCGRPPRLSLYPPLPAADDINSRVARIGGGGDRQKELLMRNKVSVDEGVAPGIPPALLTPPTPLPTVSWGGGGCVFFSSCVCVAPVLHAGW